MKCYYADYHSCLDVIKLSGIKLSVIEPLSDEILTVFFQLKANRFSFDAIQMVNSCIYSGTSANLIKHFSLPPMASAKQARVFP